jgi:hypothetical protein
VSNSEGAGATSSPISLTVTATASAEKPTFSGATTFTGIDGGISLTGVAVSTVDSDDTLGANATISGISSGWSVVDTHANTTITGNSGTVAASDIGSLVVVAPDASSSATDALTLTVSSSEGSSTTSAAETITVTATPVDPWLNANNGDWNKGSNWRFGLPTSTTDAEVKVSGTYTVTISSADVAHSLTILDPGATVLDNTVGSLTLGGGTGVLTVNQGIFQLAGGGLQAGSINVGPGGEFLVSPGQYTGSNALAETITDNGSVVIAKTSNVAFTGPISGTGAGSFTFENSSKTTITGNVSGSESFLVENSAQAVISGTINATGSISIANSAFLELGADNENVNFQSNSSGTVQIDNYKVFTGSVSGLTSSNHIDLADLAWKQGHMTATFTPNNPNATSGGTLAVSNGTGQTDTITLVGNYTQSSWTLSKDSNGNTLVTDPLLNSSSGTNGSVTTPAPVSSVNAPTDALGAGSGNAASIAALLNQFNAAGFQNGPTGAASPFGTSPSQSSLGETAFEPSLTKPHG